MLTDSKRKDMNFVEISVLAESFLSQLLGRSMIYVHGTKNEKDWKKLVAKIARAIEKSIHKTVITDGYHLFRLKYYVERLQKACKSKSVADTDIIFSLTGIVFELLGGVPDYRRRKILNKKDDYCLDTLRTLGYFQDPQQKVWTILEASRYKPYSQFHKHSDLFDQFANELNWNSTDFIDWYKKKYAKVYLRLF